MLPNDKIKALGKITLVVFVYRNVTKCFLFVASLGNVIYVSLQMLDVIIVFFNAMFIDFFVVKIWCDMICTVKTSKTMSLKR